MLYKLGVRSPKHCVGGWVLVHRVFPVKLKQTAFEVEINDYV